MTFLGAGENTLIIAKKLKRGKRTVEKFVQNSSERRRRSDKSKFRIIGRRQLMNLKRVVSQLPLSTSKTIFSEAGINVLSKSSRCRNLRKVATVRKAIKQPLMRKIHKEKRLHSMDVMAEHVGGWHMEGLLLPVFDVNKVGAG